MIKVFQERDKVILDLGSRRDTVLLSCSQALDFAEALDSHADLAEKAAKLDIAVFRGEVWNCKVESFDGKVAIRFLPPPSLVGNPKTVPLPACAARQMAEVVRSKESFARHKMRLVLQGVN